MPAKITLNSFATGSSWGYFRHGTFPAAWI
ncbi:hypothetical protein DSM3645_03508 [Blastopirellula marina DSM 3645]|uniref:Uncharacterized protein n=1 Tax=Blastopirellula marina DSM 3645 TaxID=314230 RepID=A3ZW15_9BACT|nr:hypothetical protein DSM3645_03508 [Blastopirellula marina DSM 3645]